MRIKTTFLGLILSLSILGAAASALNATRVEVPIDVLEIKNLGLRAAWLGWWLCPGY